MTPEDGGDAALLRLTAAGDARAYARFVDHHQGGVWRRAMALTGAVADAEDLMQETFLAAWRGASGFRGGSARAWLLTIAGHQWLRMSRPARRMIPVGEDDTLERLALSAGWGDDGTADDAGSEQYDLIRQAFARLTIDDRRLLTLREVEDLPGDDVATLLGLSLAAMKSRLHRARLRLAAAYEEVRRGSA